MSPGQSRGDAIVSPRPPLTAPEVTREWPADGPPRDWPSPLLVGLMLTLLAVPIAAAGLGLGWCLLVGALAGLFIAWDPR